MKKTLTLFAVLVFAATQFQLLAQVPNLVITEIMYNGPESGTDTTEFIEIYNNDTVVVNLSGYHFVQGVVYTFPSVSIDTNSYFILAYDSVKFNNFFGISAYEWASGGLSNGGEDIILVTNNGDTVDIVDYDDGGIWPNAADGDGYSLTLCNPNLDNDNGANWTAATTFVGTNSAGDSIWANPGLGCVVINPPIPIGDTIAPIVNSAIALNDTVIEVVFNEVVDTTAENILNYTGISGIATAVLDTTQMKVSLALSTALVSGQTYNLTINNVKDTAQNIMDSAQTFAVMYTAPTPSIIPNLVITEIMYNGPESGTDTTEFIEIYNNDTMAVNLAGYYFVQGVTYTFPSVSIDTNSFFVLALDSVKFNNFFGTSAYQWTSGGLKNSGEDIILVTNNGDTVDIVDYDDGGIWPNAADGDGYSLTLCNPNLDNDNGANWSIANSFVGLNANNDSIWANPGLGCVVINPPIPVGDTIAPIVNSAIALNDTVIEVVFNEVVDTTAENISNYTGISGISTAILNVSQTKVSLSLSPALISGQTYNLTINNVKDTAQNMMDSAQTFAVMYTAPTPSIIPNLVITEIMYNGPESGPDTTEFIEIYNNDTMAVNLAGYNFVQGFTYTFPAVTIDTNSYVVLALDSVKFTNFFGTTAYQWTSGSLKNSGEDIILVTNNGDTVDVVDYDDSGVWPTSPDGNGPSLTLCNPNIDNNNGSNWIAATTFVGTNSVGDSIWANPGVACPLVPTPPSGDTIPPMVNNINVISSASVEVYFDEVVDATAENINNYTGLGTINSAVLNTNGNMVTLVCANSFVNGNLNVLSINNISDTVGNIMQQTQTFDFIYNASIESIVIDEIMYNDITDDDSLEYFEIVNNSTAAANISGYKLTEGVDYIFPANTIISSYGYLVIAKDSALINSTFGITGTHQWTSGGLKNSGEDIEIQNTVGDVIDYVDYDDANPWPVEADGDGYALEFHLGSGDNNIGSSWFTFNAFFAVFHGDTIYGTPGRDNIYESIEENASLRNISIYPNPANDIVYVKVEQGSYLVKIYNISGRIVKEVKIANSNNSISLESLKSGIYMIMFVDEKTGAVGYRKLVIKN